MQDQVVIREVLAELAGLEKHPKNAALLACVFRTMPSVASHSGTGTLSGAGLAHHGGSGSPRNPEITKAEEEAAKSSAAFIAPMSGRSASAERIWGSCTPCEKEEYAVFLTTTDITNSGKLRTISPTKVLDSVEIFRSVTN